MKKIILTIVLLSLIFGCISEPSEEKPQLKQEAEKTITTAPVQVMKTTTKDNPTTTVKTAASSSTTTTNKPTTTTVFVPKLSQQEIEGNLTHCSWIKPDYWKYDCYMDLAKELKDEKYCDPIGDKDYRGDCYTKIAVDKENIEICQKIEAADRKTACEAILEKDVDKCATIEGFEEQDECIQATAEYSKDIGDCEKFRIKEDVNYLKDHCMKRVRKSEERMDYVELYSGCKQHLIDISRGYCLRRIAQKNNDTSICDKTTPDEQKDICYAALGQKLQNDTLCQLISLQSEKDECYYNVSISKRDEIICDNIGDKYKKDLCLLENAYQELDAGGCEQIEETLVKQFCIRDIALEMLKPELCEKIDESAIKDECYKRLSWGLDNVSYCHPINDEMERDNCKLIYATIHANISICDNVTDVNVKVWCQAAVKKDWNICKTINHNYHQRFDCFRYLAVETGRPQICDQADQLDFYREYCWNVVGSILKDFKTCEKCMEEGYRFRNQCIAIANQDRYTCYDTDVRNPYRCMASVKCLEKYSPGEKHGITPQALTYERVGYEPRESSTDWYNKYYKTGCLIGEYQKTETNSP
jgi:hypothetical protein